MFRRLVWGGAIFAVIVGLAFVLLWAVSADSTERRLLQCEKVRAIASDGGKVQYLRNWIEVKLPSAQVQEILNKHAGLFMADESRSDFHALGIDWNYLGLKEEYARIELDSTSVTFWEGRHGVSVNATGKVGFKQPPGAEAPRMYVVSPDVAAYCD